MGAQIDRQLEDSAVNFLSDTNRNRFSSSAQKLELSSIFEWYGEDFVKKIGSLEAFLAPRITSSAADQATIRAKKVSISYLAYDWSLNESN